MRPSSVATSLNPVGSGSVPRRVVAYAAHGPAGPYESSVIPDAPAQKCIRKSERSLTAIRSEVPAASGARS